MTHPLYAVAQRCIGRPVYVYHVSGRVYHGLLHSTTPGGIYVYRYAGQPRMISTDEAVLEVSLADDDYNSPEMTQVYAPLAFFGFGALTGLTLGALASPYGYYW